MQFFETDVSVEPFGQSCGDLARYECLDCRRLESYGERQDDGCDGNQRKPEYFQCLFDIFMRLYKVQLAKITKFSDKIRIFVADALA